METEAVARGGAFKDFLHVVSETFQKAAQARAAGVEGAMQPGMEEAVLRQTRLGGMMRSGSGMSISQLMKEFEKGPEALDAQIKTRKDMTPEQIASGQELIDNSHSLSIQFQELKEAVGGFLSMLASSKPPQWMTEMSAPPAPGLAEGGLVTGPGTGTSDSINARLSHGEHVTKAAAVKFWGTDFMDAINRMVLPGFADGGMFGPGVALPGSFEGGKGLQPGGMGTVNLHLDGQTFSGLRAPSDVMRSLSHYAIGRQTASTGRKPSWVT
jgi:hypothetical protein